VNDVETAGPVEEGLADGRCRKLVPIIAADQKLARAAGRECPTYRRASRSRPHRWLLACRSWLSPLSWRLADAEGRSSPASVAGIDDQVLAAEAERVDVGVTPLSRFALAPPARGGLVIGYGRIHEDALDPAVAALARSVRQAEATAERQQQSADG
jgi:hypothetical protein